MPFIRRDATGAIVEALEAPTGTALEYLEPDDPEVTRFVRRQSGAEQIRDQLHVSDADMARVVEDLVEALIKKGVLAQGDLHEAVHRKLARRRELRKTLNSLSKLMTDDDSV